MILTLRPEGGVWLNAEQLSGTTPSAKTASQAV